MTMTRDYSKDLLKLSIHMTSQRDDLWVIPRFGQCQPIDQICIALKQLLYEKIKDATGNHVSDQKRIYFMDHKSLRTLESDFKLYVEVDIVNNLDTDYSPIPVEYVEP